ncbi:MAG: hypothetical protein Kow00107_01590 [Planctomycetota bacterium]
MQVGRVYKLILFVLVFIVIAVVVMWGRGGSDAPNVPEGNLVADLQENELEEADSEEIIIPEADAPPEVSKLNPYAPGGLDVPEEIVPEEEIVIEGTPQPADSPVAPLQEPSFDETLPQASERYEVKSGDNLEKISLKFYNKRSLWPKIAEANSLKAPYALKIGQMLVIPAIESAPTNSVTDDSTAETVAAGSARTYKVQAGDTLQTISKKFYNTYHKWSVIAKANNITNPASLKVGQDLVIPDVPASKTVASSENTEAASVPGTSETAPDVPQQDGKYYVVQSGDSLWKIAKKVYGNGNLYNVIYEANKEKLSGNNLKPGQKLIIPEVTKAKVPAPPSNAAVSDSTLEKSSIPANVQESVEVYNFYE